MGIKQKIRCTKCSEYKFISEFSKKNCSRGKNYYCRQCHSKYNTEWAKKNKYPRHEYQVNYRIKNRSKIRGYGLKSRLKKFGLTLDIYKSMVKNQNGKCLICEELSKRNLCVDHNHSNGKIRGLLCQSCNLVIGNAKDNADILKSAIKYLQRENYNAML